MSLYLFRLGHWVRWFLGEVKVSLTVGKGDSGQVTISLGDTPSFTINVVILVILQPGVILLGV